MMISPDDYFGPWLECEDATAERIDAAEAMLVKVDAILTEAEQNGVPLDMNPKTGTLVSGEQYGGFRPQSCPEGAPHSAHKEGRAVDVYDPHGLLDKWITDLCLERHELYREHPADTVGWCHLTDRAPPSGRRSFHP